MSIRPLFSVLFAAALLPLRVEAQTASLELLYNWTNPNFAPSSAFANTYNECWGFVQDGTEYAVIGTSWGTHFFDLTDPNNIVQVDSVEGAFTGAGVIHRDYDDYDGYMYAVCDEGSGTSTLQIMDLRSLPDSVTVVYDDKDKLSTAHNIFIDRENARLYVFLAGFAPGFSSVALFSLADPVDPQLVKLYNAGSSVHDGYVRDNISYLNDGFNGRVLVMDWSGVETFLDEPVVLGSLDSYPDQGYNHSGWLSDDGNTYVFADENPGLKMKVVDVSDPTDINVLSTFNSGIDVLSMAHNQIFRGQYLFTAHYHDGIYIHDLSDPTDPQYVTHYKTYLAEDHTSYRGAWGVYPLLPSGLIIVSDMQYGLFVFRANGLVLGDNAPDVSVTVTGVAPNPVVDRVRLTAEAREQADARLYLADLQGRIVTERQVSLQAGTNQLELQWNGDLPSGLYILRLETPTAGFSEQLIKLGRD